MIDIKKSPGDTEIQTFYAGIKNGDSKAQIGRMLNITRRELNNWIKKGKRAKKKKRKGYDLTQDEKDCLDLVNIIRSAKIRRKRG